MRDEEEHRTLQRKEAGDQPDDDPWMAEQHGEFDAHADRDEEEAEQHALEGLDRRLDLVAVFRFGEEHAGEECAERHRQSRGLEYQRDG